MGFPAQTSSLSLRCCPGGRAPLWKKVKAGASPEPPELCTEFLLHFKALLLLLWLVSVVLLQETSHVAGQLAEAMAGEEGPFNYFWSPVVFSPFLRYLCSPGSRTQSNSHCSWMLSVLRAVISCCSSSKFHAHHLNNDLTSPGKTK